MARIIVCMTDDRSNSAATISAHLARAREHYERGLESHVMAVEEINAALSINPDLNYHEIGEAMGVAHTTVKRLLDWWKRGADRTDPPFGGEDARTARLARAGRQILREQPELMITELLKDPKATRQIIRDLQKGLAAQKLPSAKEPPPPPENSVLFQLRDHIEMGEHRLLVGSSDNTYFKHLVLRFLGIPQGHVRNEYPERYGIETGIVVVSDPPYGKHYPGVPGDDNANHQAVYNLLKPRGGFCFAAYEPPLFRAAEDGIRAAGGMPVHYLAMQTRGAMGQGPENRLRNVLQAIIYWERNGEEPWVAGRDAVSVLEANEEARVELREVRKLHATPKPVNVMEKLIDLVTEEGDWVLDPFAGSGSTLVACERTKRRFIGFEMHEPYAEVAVQRWQEETKQQAIVHRSYADPPTMLFDELKGNGGWVERPDGGGA